MPRSSVRWGETLHRSCAYSDVVVMSICGAAHRQPVLDHRLARHEDRDQPSLAVEHRIALDVGDVVGVEHVVGGRLRVAAGVGGREVLDPALDVVAAGAGPGEQPGHRSGELLVVAILGVGGVEVRRVVVAEVLRQRDERRIEDVGGRAALVAEAQLLARELAFGEQVLAPARRDSWRRCDRSASRRGYASSGSIENGNVTRSCSKARCGSSCPAPCGCCATVPVSLNS